MTSIYDYSAISGTGTGTRRQAGSTSAQNSSSTSQFETFLKMLTTQIKHQDPLNPMEGTEFAVQLATFSGVEQQVQTNQLLLQLLQGGGGGELGQLSSWIGREVRTSRPVWFDQQPLTLTIDGVADADSATLVTLDENGNEVLRENIGPGSGEIDWLGKRTNGALLPSGFYSFRIEATRNEEIISSRDIEAYSRVTGVEMTGNGPRLILSGGGSAMVGEISALRA